MKILHFINDLRVGGTENSLVQYCIEDKNNDHMIISFGSSSAFQDKLEYNRIKLKKLDIKKNIFFFVKNLFRELKVFKPDIIHSWMYHSHLISFLISMFGYNVFWSIRNHDISKKNLGIKTFILIKFLSVVSNFLIKKIIFNSNKAMNEHIAKGFSKKKSLVIYNGIRLPVNLNLFAKPNPAVLNIICVGRYHPVKNHNLIFKALHLIGKENVSYKCTFVGEGFDHSNHVLVSQLKKLDIYHNLTLLPYLENIKNFYQNFDINILTSNFESFPNVLAESMICGTPCISTDVGEARKIIFYYGYIIEKNNVTQLKNSIINFIKIKNNNKQLIDIKKNCQKHIQNNFSMDSMIEKFNHTYNTI